MELVTARLTLRELALDDAEACHEYESDPEVVRYQSQELRSLEQSRAYIARVRAASDAEPRHLFDLAIVERDGGRVVGRVGVLLRDPEAREGALWYVLRRDRWGRGYVTEAARAMSDFAFERLRLHRLVVDCDPRNTASVRVAEKLGMRKEAHLLENLWFKGGWADTVLYALLEREWRARSGRAAP